MSIGVYSCSQAVQDFIKAVEYNEGLTVKDGDETFIELLDSWDAGLVIVDLATYAITQYVNGDAYALTADEYNAK